MFPTTMSLKGLRTYRNADGEDYSDAQHLSHPRCTCRVSVETAAGSAPAPAPPPHASSGAARRGAASP